MIELKLRPAGRDFFVKLLIEHGWKRVYIILGITFFLALLPILLSIPAGNFINNNLEIDASRDVGYFDQFFMLLPFFVLFVPYYLNGLSTALNSLIESKVVVISEEEALQVETYSNKLFSNWFITTIPYVISLSFVALDLVTFILAGKNNWNSAAGFNDLSVGEIINIILVFFMFFLLSVLFLRIVLTYFIINKFLNGRVDIQPLHPDNCGGLSPLGDFSLRLTKAGIVVGIPILMGIYSQYYQHGFPILSFMNILLIGGYIFCLSVLFFLPLLGARRSMIVAKREQLKVISDHFHAERKNILSNINHEKNLPNIEISNLEGLMKLYDIAKVMPVFPFNSQNIARFLSSILWLVVLLVIQFIIEKI